MHTNFPYFANCTLQIVSPKALRITLYIDCLLIWRRFADHTTNALSNATWGKGVSKQQQNQMHSNARPTAETRAPNNFGTSYYLAHFKSQHSCNTSILLIVCLPFAHCSLAVPKHKPEYISFHKGVIFFMLPSSDQPDLLL